MSTLAAGEISTAILVADSNQTQSQLLSSALRRHPGFRVVTCAAELGECLRALELEPFHVALLRDSFPNNGRGRYEMLRTLHANFPEVGLVLLLDTYDRDLVVNALRCGASGLFCLADEPFKSLCRCVTSVQQGQIWANTEQFRFVIDALAMTPALRVINANGDDLLTEREQEVVALVAEGISNREIARELAVTENTVKKALLRIYDKLGVSNRVELVLYALSHQQTLSAPRGLPAKPQTTATRQTEHCAEVEIGVAAEEGS